MTKITPRFKATNKNGAIIFQDSETVRQYVRTLQEEIAVVISNYRIPAKRSNPQNRYYFGVVLPVISDYTGYSIEEIHDLLKQKFLLEDYILHLKEGQEEIRIPKSTTKLTTVEFEAYLSEIREWASKDLSVYVPLPNEVSY